MKSLLVAVALTLAGAAAAQGQSIQISPNDSRPSILGTAQTFTGHVVVDPLFTQTEHTHATGGQVTFAPGARTRWHTHPAGQTLIVLSGTGWIQEWGGEKKLIKPGDVIWIPPGIKHWHGATATGGMMHIAVQEMVDGRNVNWFEPVSDDQYVQ